MGVGTKLGLYMVLLGLMAYHNPCFALEKELASPSTQPQDEYIVPVSLFKGRVSNQPTRYILGPGDEVSIKVKDLDKYNHSFSIRPDGYASLYPFGEVYIAGLDVQALEEWLEEKFKFYLVKPEITVDVEKMRPTMVYISGAVNRPGTYQFVRNAFSNVTYQTPQENAEITLSNVLAKAGGINDRADIDHIEVIHESTGEKEIFSIRDLLSKGETKDIWLLPGDAIVVPELKQPMDPATFSLISRSTFYKGKFPVVVLGAVEQQGEVQVDPNNNSLNAALALAGGFVQNVSKCDAFLVQRPSNNGGFHRFVVDAKKVQFSLQPGDVVYVAHSKLAKLEHGLKVLSNLTQPAFMSGAAALNYDRLYNK